MTCSDKQAPCELKVQKIISSTFENSKSCEEIFSVLKERIYSKRSTNLNIIKVKMHLKLRKAFIVQTLDIIEILLLHGSEKFISIATNEKEAIMELKNHPLTKGKFNI